MEDLPTLVLLASIVSAVSGFFVGAAGGFIAATTPRRSDLLVQGARTALVILGALSIALGFYLQHHGYGVLASRAIFGGAALGMVVGFPAGRGRE